LPRDLERARTRDMDREVRDGDARLARRRTRGEVGVAPVSKLDDLRAQIDSLDAQILAILEKRAATVEGVAEAKREAGLASYYDPERERAVLDRLAQKGAGRLPRGAPPSALRQSTRGWRPL